MDNQQLSTISNSAMMALTIHVSVDDSPVATRLIQRIPDGIPVKAVEAILKTDLDITTADQSVRSLEPSVRSFAGIYGERTLAAIILSHLTLVEDLANVSRQMKPEAMAMLAKKVTAMLLAEDVSINLADLQIVANRMINGEAGSIYGGLNSQIVTKAFTDYICEKAEAFSGWRQEQAREHSFGSFGNARSKEHGRLSDQQAMKMYLEGTLKKDIKTK